MTLINCPECKKEISDKAEICIHCGFPLDKYLTEEEDINNIFEDLINRIKKNNDICPYNIMYEEECHWSSGITKYYMPIHGYEEKDDYINKLIKDKKIKIIKYNGERYYTLYKNNEQEMINRLKNKENKSKKTLKNYNKESDELISDKYKGDVFDFEYENEYKKLERNLKKYNILAFKKLYFDYYPSLRSGKFIGDLIDCDKKEQTETYELKLPSDLLFQQVHGEVKLVYKVLNNLNTVVLMTIEPEDILLERHVAELTTYKGVMISKQNAEKDKFMINLFSALDNRKK